MILHEMAIQNFQSFGEEVRLSLAPLTLLYGPNSVGKSVFADAMEILRLLSRDPQGMEKSIKPWLRRKDDHFSAPCFETSFYVDHDVFQKVGSALLSDHPWLYRRVSGGCNVSIRVRLFGIFIRCVEELEIRIDDEPILSYRRGFTRLDVLFRPIEDGFSNTMPEEHFLFGESEIPQNSELAEAMALAKMPSTTRGKLLCNEDNGNFYVRGMSCEVYEEPGEFFKTDVNWDRILSPPLIQPSPWEMRLFADQGGDGRVPSVPKVGMAEYFEKWVEYFCSVLPEKSDHMAPIKENVQKFVELEFSFEDMLDLHRSLETISSKLSSLVRAVLSLQAAVLDAGFVPGDRRGFDSSDIFHIANIADQENPGFSPFDGMIPFRGVPRRYAPLTPIGFANDSLSLERLSHTAKAGAHDVLREYFSRRIQKKRDKEPDGKFITYESEDQGDFVNYALSNHLKSLSRYRIGEKQYFLNDPSASEIREGGLHGSCVVLPGVFDEDGDFRSLNDVGSSLGFLLPVLASIGLKEFSIIEQPELHLHPKLQDELAQVFIDSISKNRRMLIETHSEIFMLRCAQQIAAYSGIDGKQNVAILRPELGLAPQDIAVYYMSSSSSGDAQIRRMNFADDGSLIDIWPHGFFEDSWTSGFDRLQRFSTRVDDSRALRDWPWIEAGHPAVVATHSWLVCLWAATSKRASFPVVSTVYCGKIVETVLAEMLFDPVRDRVLEADLAESEFREFVQCFRAPYGSRYPSIGAWRVVLRHLMMPSRYEKDPVVTAFSRFLREREWYKIFQDRFQALDRGLELLSRLRNLSAHTGEPLSDEVEKILPVVVRDRGPGLIFQCVGISGGKWHKQPYPPEDEVGSSPKS